MIFRVPLWLKRIYSPAVMRLEKLLAGFHSRSFSLAVICRWEKKWTARAASPPHSAVRLCLTA